MIFLMVMIVTTYLILILIVLFISYTEDILIMI